MSVKERPILFSAPMVRAILNGKKTQTRRIVKDLHGANYNDFLSFNKSEDYKERMRSAERFGFSPKRYENGEGSPFHMSCPYGKKGDRLWVREAFSIAVPSIASSRFSVPIYRADHGYTCGGIQHDCAKWKPSIHMPRKVSRILLEITSVRVEKLNDITNDDAYAEGITDGGCLSCGNSEPCGCELPHPCAVDSFVNLWESINGQGSWHVNPWVWVVEFKRIQPETDSPVQS